MRLTIDVKLLAAWLKDHEADNYEGNMILDGLEDLYGLETELAKEFSE